MGKALFVAISFAVAYLILFTLLLRCFTIRRRAKVMTILFMASVPLFAAVFILTPSDLGFLPAWLLEPIFLVDLIFGLFLYTAAYAGGILQLYNLADRGFSLRIVLDVVRSPAGLTLDEIALAYSDGQGLRWMYAKRVADLVGARLCVLDQNNLKNLPRGTRLARLFRTLRNFFHHDAALAALSPAPRER